MRGESDPAAHLSKCNCVFQLISAVCRTELADRDIGFLNDPDHVLQAFFSSACMHMNDTGLMGKQTGCSGLGGKSGQFFSGDIGGAVVADRCLNADHFFDKGDILSH